jgi:predicted DNA-binding protein
MAVSVRLDPFMEKELELSAKRQGITKSQFIIAALERALGRKDPYKLLLQVKAEAASRELAQGDAGEGYSGELSDSEAKRSYIRQKLSEKHGLGTT